MKKSLEQLRKKLFEEQGLDLSANEVIKMALTQLLRQHGLPVERARAAAAPDLSPTAPTPRKPPRSASARAAKAQA